MNSEKQSPSYDRLPEYGMYLSQQSASGLPLGTLYLMHEEKSAPRLRHTMVVVPPQMADLVPTVIP